MSFAGELLKGSRTDVFRITDGMTAGQLKRLDLRLVQSYKRTGNTIEVKFVDILRLCELAEKCEESEKGEAVERGTTAVGKDGGRGAERLRELFDMCEGAADKDEDSDEGSGMSAE